MSSSSCFSFRNQHDISHFHPFSSIFIHVRSVFLRVEPEFLVKIGSIHKRSCRPSQTEARSASCRVVSASAFLYGDGAAEASLDGMNDFF